MAYDALAESRRLIAEGITDDPERLSRRRRFAAVAVDVDGDVACTYFVRRGPGCVHHDLHLLVREGGTWRLLGGGDAGAPDDGLADRPQARTLGRPLVFEGHSAVVRNADRLMPWGSRWVHSAQLQASREVADVVVGRRQLPVPRHGRLVVVWSARRPPEVLARRADGAELDRVRLPVGPPAVRWSGRWGQLGAGGSGALRPAATARWTTGPGPAPAPRPPAASPAAKGNRPGR